MSVTTSLEFESLSDESSTSPADATVLIGKKEDLEKVFLQAEDSPLKSLLPSANALLEPLIGSISGKSGTATTLVPSGESSSFHTLTVATLPSQVSRNNHHMSVHTLTQLVKSTCSNSKHKSVRLIVVVDTVGTSPSASKGNHQGPLAAAVAKAFPLYSRKGAAKSSENDEESSSRIVKVSFLPTSDDKTESSRVCQVVADAVQKAAQLVDMPPAELTTDAYATTIAAAVKNWPHVTMREIVGEELEKNGYGGLYNVGKAAECPPRLVILEYTPPTPATKKVALVGKGIVFDTGGLSLKPKVGMCGMKHDMGGSAGLWGAFYAAVELEAPVQLKLLLCLAENAIGPSAVRNDDIITMYSGKTVEVNNADAEGRLVLGDGVAHATKHFEDLDLVVDMATLTGAQLVATGKKHAGILCNQEKLEQQMVAAGLYSGDLCYPLLYAPELLQSEFDSKVADMKNSVKDRSNAQTSCAGHFIESHLDEEYEGSWIHIDMAGPGSQDERGTGYGVALILALLEVPGF